MLERTFVHVPGIAHTAERALWAQGCVDWRCALSGIDRYSFGSATSDVVHATLNRSVEALANLDSSFFRNGLGAKEAWRAFPEFREHVGYLDIETDGGHGGDNVTVVGLFDGREFHHFVRDLNLDDFPDAMASVRYIVTFYGNGFDLPMLQKRFRGLEFPQLHMDLCPTLRRLGHKGGLKRIEKSLGISRGEDTDGLSGLDAVRLWRDWQHRDNADALRTLIAYNREDVVNLERLAEIAYDGLRKAAFLHALD